MIKIIHALSKEIGNLLAGYRKNSHLTQTEIAKRLGLSQKSGPITISRLEKGKFKKLSLDLILSYLTICEKPWHAFFEKLQGIYFAKQHHKIMTQVAPPMHHKKIDRDVAKYMHSIDSKFSKKQTIKPMSQEKKDKMSLRFGKHRAIIEPIEKEVTYLLGDSGEPYILNQYYKAFAREIYSTLRKIAPQKSLPANSALNSKLQPIIDKWVKKGLKQEILEKIKEIPVKYFQSPMKTNNNSKSKNQN